jgi:hypothetical protein
MSRKPISPNFYRGKAVKSIEELANLAELRKSVYHYHWGIKPAAVIINLPICTVLGEIRKGFFYNITK